MKNRTVGDDGLTIMNESELIRMFLGRLLSFDHITEKELLDEISVY